MPDDERHDLAVALARVEERIIAQGQRIARLERLVSVTSVAIIGAIVTAAARIL